MFISKMSEFQKGIKEVFSVSMYMLVVSVVLQVLLDLPIFTSITIINVTALSDAIGLFLVGIFALFSLAGTALGLTWGIGKFKGLFSKKSGIDGISA